MWNKKLLLNIASARHFIGVIYKTRHLKYDTNYKQYENRSYTFILSEFLDQTWSFIRHVRHGKHFTEG
jgi:hypothetical protein